MTTPTLEIIHQHGSVRNYKQDPVSEDLIRQIVTAGQRASTSSNLQTYSVVVTTDSENKLKLEQISGGQKHISQAPVFLLWCADFSRLKRVCEHQGYDLEPGYVENFMVGTVDAAIAMQNAALAAESLGLGFCFIGSIRNAPGDLIEMFHLPKLVFPVAGMTLGWPVESPQIRPRLPLDAVLHWETYQQNDLNYLNEYDRVMIKTGIYGGRQIDSQDQAPEDYGWMEHSARRSSKPSRPHLRESIRKSGFLLK
ncbi:MAG: NADPH-dependent oxidoreductase [Anaerolineales bacterium]|nr:NADPH-dependent oxidoreductase [Anaerolineales bacterium]